eukprot:TRINITY_DN6035_c0_g1_i1.p1 TRINITY_DN6035_c0_g1~~TRINITY_DN6035_c0_g1_i1.p1  ORF type:complete len:362 (-),score=44.05 TRINITY_DN6035_c0_g1_i1:42-1127(-)
MPPPEKRCQHHSNRNPPLPSASNHHIPPIDSKMKQAVKGALFGNSNTQSSGINDLPPKHDASMHSTTMSGSSRGVQPSISAPTPISNEPSMLGTSSTSVVQLPVVVHETIRHEQVEEIQPIITREHERTKIIQAQQPLFDKEIRPVTYRQETLPGTETTMVSEQIPTEYSGYFTKSEYTEGETVKVEKAPIIIETIKNVTIEELHPVIYREIVHPQIIRTIVPVSEKQFFAEYMQGNLNARAEVFPLDPTMEREESSSRSHHSSRDWYPQNGSQQWGPQQRSYGHQQNWGNQNWGQQQWGYQSYNLHPQQQWGHQQWGFPQQQWGWGYPQQQWGNFPPQQFWGPNQRRDSRSKSIHRHHSY